jgi:hypothetical protein
MKIILFRGQGLLQCEKLYSRVKALDRLGTVALEGVSGNPSWISLLGVILCFFDFRCHLRGYEGPSPPVPAAEHWGDLRRPFFSRLHSLCNTNLIGLWLDFLSEDSHSGSQVLQFLPPGV